MYFTVCDQTGARRWGLSRQLPRAMRLPLCKGGKMDEGWADGARHRRTPSPPSHWNSALRGFRVHACLSMCVCVCVCVCVYIPF